MPDSPAKIEKPTWRKDLPPEPSRSAGSILIQGYEQHSGPLPSPPAMAEKEQAHRHEIANRDSRTASFAQNAGLVLAGSLALVGVLGGLA